MNISFIGFGSMAKAIARGLAQENKHKLCASAPSLTVGINQDKIHTHFDNKSIVRHADVVVLAVKPNQMDKVLQEIVPELPAHCLLISVAAGLSLQWFASRFTISFPLIRTMPNTPAAIGLGATPMIANSYVTKEHYSIAEGIFSPMGLTHWVTNEQEMDAFTALSGSGPAFVFAFVEALINAAVALEINNETATSFAIQTCKGALSLAEQSALSLSELRAQVTSPGGTTEAGLTVLKQPLKDLMCRTLKAARDRAQELGQSY